MAAAVQSLLAILGFDRFNRAVAAGARKPLKASVVMATFNGEPFIAEQLDSLAAQSRLPDELIVADDCSTDRTLELVRSFARRAPFEVRIDCNTTRLGSRRNFLNALRLCSGDVFAFCDQDDVWLPNKVGMCIDELEADPDVVMVVHSARVVNQDLIDLGRRYPAIPHRIVTTPDSPLRNFPKPGFAIVASRALIEVCDPLQDPGFREVGGHDNWVPFLAQSLGKVVYLPDDLALYRQHGGNSVGVPSLGAQDVVTRARDWRGIEVDRLRDVVKSARAQAEVCERLRARPDALITSVSSAMVSFGARTSRRVATVNERRARLYECQPLSVDAAGQLAASALKGDYGRRSTGGSGLPSFGRDLLHVLGMLDAFLSRRMSMPRGDEMSR